MAYKKRFFFLIMLFIAVFLFAQVTESAEPSNQGLVDEEFEEVEVQELNYYLDRSGREPRFIQRLIWHGDEYALRYVLIVQKRENDGRFTEVERVETETNVCEVSLVAGRYRYSVEVYDLFDELAFTTNWHEFDVIRAIQPILSSFDPGNFYLDEDEEWVITVRGRNFLPETEFVLVQDNSRIRPQNVTLEGNTARLEFSGSSLFPGKFAVYARNPGGLDHSVETFGISNKKPFDFNISVGFAPVISLFGYLFQDFQYDGYTLEAPFTDTFYPLSGLVRISFLPIKRTWGNIGVDLSGSFTLLSGGGTGYTTNAYLINGHASFLYQKHFLKRTFFINLHVGGGIFTVMDFTYDFGGSALETTTNTFISAIGGLSFTYIFRKPWFATIGADYIHAFTTASEDRPMPAIIRPYVLFGIQL